MYIDLSNTKHIKVVLHNYYNIKNDENTQELYFLIKNLINNSNLTQLELFIVKQIYILQKPQSLIAYKLQVTQPYISKLAKQLLKKISKEGKKNEYRMDE